MNNLEKIYSEVKFSLLETESTSFLALMLSGKTKDVNANLNGFYSIKIEFDDAILYNPWSYLLIIISSSYKSDFVYINWIFPWTSNGYNSEWICSNYRSWISFKVPIYSMLKTLLVSTTVLISFLSCFGKVFEYFYWVFSITFFKLYLSVIFYSYLCFFVLIFCNSATNLSSSIL